MGHDLSGRVVVKYFGEVFGCICLGGEGGRVPINVDRRWSWGACGRVGEDRAVGGEEDDDLKEWVLFGLHF